MRAELVFSADGTGRGLYTEAVDLAAIGRLRVSRASRVEFDNRAGLWRVYPPRGGEALFSHRSRRACIEWEHTHPDQLRTAAQRQA